MEVMSGAEGEKRTTFNTAWGGLYFVWLWFLFLNNLNLYFLI